MGLNLFCIISRSVGPLAQSVEQLTFNQLVERSNRSRPTISFKRLVIVSITSLFWFYAKLVYFMNIEEKNEDEQGGIVNITNSNGEEMYLYSILSKDFINENGLLNVAVVGKFTDTEIHKDGSLVVDSFQANPDFVYFFHEFLDSFGRNSSSLSAKATQQEEGSWVYLIDQRVKDINATAAPEDIIGGFKVEQGKLGEYAGNPSHVLLTKAGIFQLEQGLKAELISTIKAQYKKPH